MSGEIRLTPQEIIAVSKDLAKQATQIEQASKSADSSANKIRHMKSNRLERDIQAWDNLRKKIDQAVVALRDGAEELNNLAKANIAANQ
jgi:hypothetical protein